MRKLKINKKTTYFVIVFSVLVLIILFGYIKFKNSFNQIKEPNQIFYPYQKFKNLNNIQSYFSNREILVIKESNEILIGRNKKELQNEYYDIKFCVDSDELCIKINNLQKEDKEFKSISEEYINELKLFLQYLLNIKDEEKVINMLKDEYIKLRNNNECITPKNNLNGINIEMYNVKFSIENNMLKLDISL